MKRIASLMSVAACMVAATAYLVAGSAAAQGSLPTITLTLTGKSITVGGTPVTGAVNVVSTVSGEKQGEPTLVYLKPGVNLAQVFAAAAKDPNALDPYGAIVMDANVFKGTGTVQTVLSQPGTYLALDTIGNNPAKWPMAQFTVAPSSAPATLPPAQATIKTIEFGFRGAATLHNGELVRFENAGYLVHMVDWIGVRNAAGARQLTALLLAGKDKQLMKVATSFGQFMGPASSGAVEQFVVHAKPGIYVLACFMDTQDGREHTQLGMERTIRIVK
ncbi:MAG TPA: hypothetical protein VMA77_28195 [Solirubrobacteraceae bacterium]|nr:hypothetical protein [Solirubrobacteraceae bacterium]